MNQQIPDEVQEQWSLILKEICGIQIVWDALNGLYWRPVGTAWANLQGRTSLLYRVTQSVYVEALLIRVARLLDPAESGRGPDKTSNLSLKRLGTMAPEVEPHVSTIHAMWDESALKTLRNKYLSHNDLESLRAGEHSFNLPLQTADIELLGNLVKAIMELCQTVHPVLTRADYSARSLSITMEANLRVLNNALQGGALFFELLPEHEFLQEALSNVDPSYAAIRGEKW